MASIFYFFAAASVYKGLTQQFFSSDQFIYLFSGILLLWFGWFTSRHGSRDYRPVRPHAHRIDAYTINVTGDVDQLRSKMTLSSIQTWEHAGRRKWNIKLTGAADDWTAREIVEYINQESK